MNSVTKETKGSSIFDAYDRIFNPYTEKERKVGEKILTLIFESELLDSIKNPVIEHVRFQYVVDYQVMNNFEVKIPFTLNVYDYRDRLVYKQYVEPHSTTDLHALCEYSNYLAYHDLMRYEILGFSEKYETELMLQCWDRKFDKKMEEELRGMYGITPSMRIYNLIKEKIYNEIKRIIEHGELQHWDPQIGGGRNIAYQSDGWYQFGRRGVEGEMRNVTIRDYFGE
jgi:hypothetical protein